jgi:hypothetical protein
MIVKLMMARQGPRFMCIESHVNPALHELQLNLRQPIEGRLGLRFSFLKEVSNRFLDRCIL